MCKENEIFIENYNGFAIKTRWDNDETMLYICCKDAIKLMTNKDDEEYENYKQETIKIIKEFNYEIEKFKDFLENKVDKTYVSINSFVKIMNITEVENREEIILWLLGKYIYHLKKHNPNAIINFDSKENKFIDVC